MFRIVRKGEVAVRVHLKPDEIHPGKHRPGLHDTPSRVTLHDLPGAEFALFLRQVCRGRRTQIAQRAQLRI